ncbi:hypothetical protein U3A55_02415 [Salarchaeum sp. III]|uniref:hypothetical protein n=1 Tax=Salarchaeum sp. III TaxID=3107927 RepID=UPI002ED88968
MIGAIEFQTFLTPDKMDQLFHYVKVLLFYFAPLIMIAYAFDVLGLFVDLISRIIPGRGGKAKDKEEDDFDVFWY